jgi:hypothetical protein
MGVVGAEGLVVSMSFFLISGRFTPETRLALLYSWSAFSLGVGRIDVYAFASGIVSSLMRWSGFFSVDSDLCYSFDADMKTVTIKNECSQEVET